MKTDTKIGAVIQMSLAGLAAAFAGGALAVGAARYLPAETDGVQQPAPQVLPVEVGPAPRERVPGLYV